MPGLLAGLSNLTSGATGIPVPPVGTVQSAESYGYDEMSRLLTATRQEDGQSDTSSFTYDYSGQLTNASYGWNGRNMGYTLDNVGNRTQTNDNGSIGTYTRNPSYLNQYIAAPGGGVNNGSEHEIAGYQGLSYTYYGDRRLASVVGNGYSYYLYYDALGRCVRRELNGIRTFYVYDGEKPIYEYDVNGVRAGWNLYGKGIDEIVLRSDYVVLTHGQGYFYQQDHEGTVTHLMGFEGTRIERYRYDAFGAPTTTYTGGSFNNRFKFTGREYAEAFGIYEYRNRAYHPGLGRFTNEDPKGFDAGDYNLFRYCGNDPVDRTDPMGLQDEVQPVTHGAPGTTGAQQQDNRIEQDLLRFESYAPTAIAVERLGGNRQYAMRGGMTFNVIAKRGPLSIGLVTGNLPNGRTAIDRALALQGTKDGSRKDTKRGALYVTHYGYPNDPNGDGRQINRIGNHGNPLNNDSVALSRDFRAQFHFGDAIGVNGHYIGNYDDSAPYERGVIDVFDPQGTAGGEEFGRTIERGNYSVTTVPGE